MSTSKKDACFMDLLRQGKVKPDDFDDFVGYWHEGHGKGKTLNQYIGVTPELMAKICITDNEILWKYYNTERSGRVASKDSKLKS